MFTLTIYFIALYVYVEFVLIYRPHPVSVRDLYISRMGLPILLQGNLWTNPGNI
jgi:hypothetical protein